MEETEALLEKIWEIHDKLSDAIHAITRSHFLKSLKSLKKSPGVVYTKDFHASSYDEAAIAEARSLSAIRSALESLEDQIEFFHVTLSPSLCCRIPFSFCLMFFMEIYKPLGLVYKPLISAVCQTFKSQQWSERAAAISQLEQSCNVLAARLADHHGNKSKVIEEAMAFVGNVKENSRFSVQQNHCVEKLANHQRKGPNLWVQAFVSSFSSAAKSLKLEQMGGVLGHAALIAVGMLAFLQLHQVASKDDDLVVEACQAQDDSVHMKRRVKSISVQWGSPSMAYVNKHLDVLQARG
ncbi:hypothetical protein ACLOJK_020205 [Asimina triloba]